MIDNWRHAKPVPGEFIERQDGRIGMVMEITDMPAWRGIQYEVTVQRYPDQPADDWEVWHLDKYEYTIEG